MVDDYSKDYVIPGDRQPSPITKAFDRKESLKILAIDALNCQDACNLSGVIVSMADTCRELFRLGFSTGEINTHPIITVYLDKLVDLNDGDSPDKLREAYQKVIKLSQVGE